MEWLKDIGAIAQTGAVGVAIIALIVLYKVVVNHSSNFTNIIKKNSETNERLAETLGVHSEVIRSLENTIERKM